MPFESLLVSSLIFTACFLWLWQSGRLRGRLRQTKVEIQAPHLIQFVVQTLLFTYWSFYWDEVRVHASLIVAQIAFAYIFEMLLTWTRGKAWRLRLAPFPVVYSINLFLWFKEEYFFLQLLLLASAYLAKEFLTWDRNGRRAHIFNPSGFALAVTGLLLMLTGNVDLTYGLDLTWSFSLPPHFYEVIFLLGLVVQFLFSTTWITAGAAFTLWFLYGAAEWWLGTPLAPQPFDPAVFLGLTLLVTDPVTSPRRPLSKFVFGVTYGCGIFVAYILLRLTHQPSYFDKIIVVPFLNLMVPWCDSIADRLRVRWIALVGIPLPIGGRPAIVVYSMFFLAIIHDLEKIDYQFESPLPPNAVSLSPTMAELKVRSDAYRLVTPEVYLPFAFPTEYREYIRLSGYSPNSVDERVAFGRALNEAGRRDESLLQLKAAVVADQSSADAHLYLGQVLLQCGQTDDAVSELETARSLRPNDSKILVNLGTAHAMNGKTQDAILLLRESLEHDPEETTALVNLGRLLLQEGQRAEGYRLLLQAVRNRPASRLAHLHLGIVLFSDGEFDESRRHCEYVLFVEPQNREAQKLLAQIESRRIPME